MSSIDNDLRAITEAMQFISVSVQKLADRRAGPPPSATAAAVVGEEDDKGDLLTPSSVSSASTLHVKTAPSSPVARRYVATPVVDRRVPAPKMRAASPETPPAPPPQPNEGGDDLDDTRYYAVIRGRVPGVYASWYVSEGDIIARTDCE